MKRQTLTGILTLALLAHAPAQAQLASPNAAGVTAGHTHLAVPDLAQAMDIWKRFGGVEMTHGGMTMLSFPGMYILMIEREPGLPSIETTANHVGFTIRDYAHYRALLDDIGASIFFDDSENGQILADLPGGVRVEFAVDSNQSDPIRFHHTHLSAVDAEPLRNWYVEVFGAEVGERRGLPSALIPGGQVDVIPARGEAPKPSRGAAIDHIGFDVRDMDAFAAHLHELGIPFTIEPRAIPDTNMTIAFITDPAGTFIEVTEGLMAAQE